MKAILISLLLLALCACGDAPAHDNVVAKTASYEVIKLNDTTYLAVPINSGDSCQLFNLKQ